MIAFNSQLPKILNICLPIPTLVTLELLRYFLYLSIASARFPSVKERNAFWLPGCCSNAFIIFNLFALKITVC